MRRIAVFVDGSNLFYMQKDALGWWLDPKKLLAWLRQRGEVVDATYYTSIDENNKGQVAFSKALSHIGFSVESKPIKTVRQNDGTVKHKANLDIEIVIDMFSTIENYDEAVLVSGDSDFARPLRLLKARGKQFLVLATKGFVATEIREVAGMHFKDLGELRDQLEKG